MTGSTGSPPAGSRRRRKRPPKRVRFRGNREAPSKGELSDTVMMHQASQGVKMKIAPGDVREFVSGGEGVLRGGMRSARWSPPDAADCHGHNDRAERGTGVLADRDPLSDAVARARARVEPDSSGRRSSRGDRRP